MTRLIAVITAFSCLVLLLSSSVPALAAPDDRAVAPATDATFHALSRMPGEAQSGLTPLTDDELAEITGAAGGSFGLGGLGLNLGIFVQINVCAVCRGVSQSNFGVLGQGLSRFPGRR
jgi:hypothetical protein